MAHFKELPEDEGAITCCECGSSDLHRRITEMRKIYSKPKVTLHFLSLNICSLVLI